MKTLLFILPFLFLSIQAEESFKSPVSEINFGDSSKKLIVEYLDISNPQSWEETEFEIKRIEPFFEVLPGKKKVAFWNDKMYKVTFKFPNDVSEKLIPKFNAEYGQYQYSRPSGSELSTNWAISKGSIFMLSSQDGTTLFFTDESQKEFHFTDLFRGVLAYIIITIVSMFAVYFLIAWLITSYCSRCKTFNMQLIKVDFSNLKDYDPSLFSSDQHQDTTYIHKCSKCGSIRKDKYSGFWSWYRTKNS